MVGVLLLKGSDLNAGSCSWSESSAQLFWWAGLLSLFSEPTSVLHLACGCHVLYRICRCGFIPRQLFKLCQRTWWEQSNGEPLRNKPRVFNDLTPVNNTTTWEWAKIAWRPPLHLHLLKDFALLMFYDIIIIPHPSCRWTFGKYHQLVWSTSSLFWGCGWESLIVPFCLPRLESTTLKGNKVP